LVIKNSFGEAKASPYIHHIIKVMKISDTKFDYMNSLVVIKQAEAFDNAIRNFIIDLTEEGFETSDIKEFVNERIKRVFSEFKGYE